MIGIEFVFRGDTMTRFDVDSYINETYGVSAEHLFAKNPTTAIYRHPIGKKWFAVIMELNPKIFGLDGIAPITVVNLKVDPILGDILRTKDGFYPAYHMNQEKWITAVINEACDKQELFGLLAMSHRLTKTKKDFE